MISRRLLHVTLLLCCPLTLNAADGITIEPGMWEYTNTMTMSVMPEPITRTKQECFTESEFNAETLSKDSECNVQDYQVDDNTMTFTMVCPGPEGPSVGQGTYSSSGDSGSGEMNMTMTVNGSAQSMQMKWRGNRIGSC